MLELSWSLIYTIPVLLALNYTFTTLTRKRTWLDNVPTYGLGKGPFRRLVGLAKFATSLRYTVAEGAKACHDSGQEKVFRVPLMLTDWIYLMPWKYVGEMRNQPDRVLSQLYAVENTMGIVSTYLQDKLHTEPFHTESIRNYVLKYLHKIIPNLEDELIFAVDREVNKMKTDEEGWGLLTRDAVLNIVSCASNRNFVGLPYCRDESLSKLGKDWALTIFMAGAFDVMFPPSVRRFITPFTNLPNRIRAIRLWFKLRPMLNERLARTVEFERAKAEGRACDPLPDDLIQIYIRDGAKTRGSVHAMTAWDLVLRILVINFAAIHTTTVGVMHVLQAVLATKNEKGEAYLAQMLLDEFREVYAREVLPTLTPEQLGARDPNVPTETTGWTQKTLGSLVLFDSVVRECFRLNVTSPIFMLRLVVAPEGFTFSNGVHFPAGTMVGIPGSVEVDREEELSEPEKFDPFRYKRMLEEQGKKPEEAVGLQSTSINGKYQPFSTGRHACPGRFFAIAETKLMFKHILINYEMKPLDKKPENTHLFNNQLDDQFFKGIWIRKRPAAK